MATVGESWDVCDLCGVQIGYGDEAPTKYRVKGQELRLKACHPVDLCAKCLAEIVAEGRVMPVRQMNLPFFVPGLILGAFSVILFWVLFGGVK